MNSSTEGQQAGSLPGDGLPSGIARIDGLLERVIDRFVVKAMANLEDLGGPTAPPPRATGQQGPAATTRANARSPHKRGRRGRVYEVPSELMGAIFAIGVNRGHQVVLRECFEQLYGRDKAATLRLVPIEIERLSGVLSTNVGKSIHSLVKLGILRELDKHAYAFVEDWRAWDWTDRPARRKAYAADWGRPAPTTRARGRSAGGAR